MAVLNFLMKEERQSTYTWTIKVDAPHRDFMIIRNMKNVQCSGRFSPPRELLEHMRVADLMFLVRHYLISSSTSVLYFGLVGTRQNWCGIRVRICSVKCRHVRFGSKKDRKSEIDASMWASRSTSAYAPTYTRHRRRCTGTSPDPPHAQKRSTLFTPSP